MGLYACLGAFWLSAGKGHGGHAEKRGPTGHTHERDGIPGDLRRCGTARVFRRRTELHRTSIQRKRDLWSVAFECVEIVGIAPQGAVLNEA